MSMEQAEKAAEHLRVPDLRLSNAVFKLQLNDENRETHLKSVMEGISQYDMATWHKYLVDNGTLKADKKLQAELEGKVEKKLKEFDEKIEVCEKEEGDVDVRDAMVDRAEYLAKTGDRVNAIKGFAQIRKKCHMTTGTKLDLIFNQLKLALFYSDNFVEEKEEKTDEEEDKKADEMEDFKKDKVEPKKMNSVAAKKAEDNKKCSIKNPHDLAQNITEAKRLVDEGGDWDRRNRLKVYEAVYFIQIREFQKAANLFLDAVPTFTTYELMSYEQLVSYTVVTCMVTVNRKKMRDNLIEGSEIQQQLYGLPEMRKYLTTFYNCQYSQFFECLANMESFLKHDRYVSKHTQYYIREMRLAAYRQILASYSSLAIEYMADAFGVSVDYIDAELSKFIATGRLSAKIDHVAGIVVTNRPDQKNQQYRQVVKDGDSLLNRVQKLSRVINI